MTATEEGKIRQANRVIALFILVGLYFSFNLVFRWLRLSLLFGHAKDGWPEPSTLETAYQIYMACLPVALWTWLLYVLSLRYPRLLNRATIAVLVFTAAIAAEFDMNWFLMSKAHITYDDAVVFVMGSPEDVGMDSTEIARFVKLIIRHAVLIGLLVAVVALILGRFLTRFNLVPRLGLTRKRVGIALAVLVLADSAWVGYCARHDTRHYSPSQWGFVAYANPVRLRLLDTFWANIFFQQPDLEVANDSLRAIPTRRVSEGPTTSAAPAKPYHVVMIAVESFNARLAAQTDMAFWKKLAGRSLQLDRHYTTGNCTHYGVLGLLYGSPPIFYDGALGHDESPFLNRFKKDGYRSQRISFPLANFRNLGNYLGNFTEPDFEERDEWALIPELRAAMSRQGPQFTFVFYNKTHYAYRHGPEYNRYQPEVPEDFPFQSWDAARHVDRIANRYKNCLLELDAWLEAVVKELDMERTILVVTGDHGEEFFESGRLGHCSYLNDAQTNVPCLVSIPGRKAHRLGEVTSHADLMPTIAEALGWHNRPPSYGRSILDNKGSRTAVVAQSNQHHRPVVWGIVSADRKTIVEGHNRLRIIALFDKNDRKVEFAASPQEWAANFAEVQRFQQAFLNRVLPGSAVEGDALVSRRKAD